MNLPRKSAGGAGFTLVEMAVSLTIMLVAGGVIFSAIHTVALLGAKNSAVNYTHQQSREMIHKAVSQIHGAISIPTLADTSLADVAGNGPAAGVKYQALVSGPNKVWSNVASGASIITVTATAGKPIVAGMRLIVPAFDIEEDITAVVGPTGSPSTYTLTLAHPISTAITCASGSPNYVAYYTQRSALVMVGTDLRWYQRISSGSYVTVANNVVTPTPFTFPAGDTRYVQSAFSVRDPQAGNLLRMRSMNTNLVLTVPYRTRLTSIQ